MNRPDTKLKKIDNDEKPYKINPKYVCDLEAYCDELEKALDKTCTELVKMKLCASCYEYKESGCPFANKCELGTDYCYNKKHWKEWALKDE